MAISFEDSLKKAAENNLKNRAVPTPLSLDVDTDLNSITVYSTDEWVLDDKYQYYPEYSDDKLSVVDEDKNIVLDSNQINISQETNSQFIPFEMPRFYDGFDLSTTSILIHFVNRCGCEDYDSPINVYTSADKIKFAWLVDDRATAIDGVLNFEIQAVGFTSRGDKYTWKSRPSNSINILKSLSGDGVIKPDSSWMSVLLEQLKEHLDNAKAELEESVADAVDVKGEELLVELHNDIPTITVTRKADFSGRQGAEVKITTPGIGNELDTEEATFVYDGNDGVTPSINTVTATTLEPGSEATASVSGPTSNLALDFGIPQGIPGHTPERGVDYYTEEDKAAIVADVMAAMTAEPWVLTLEDGTTVTKAVCVA